MRIAFSYKTCRFYHAFCAALVLVAMTSVMNCGAFWSPFACPGSAFWAHFECPGYSFWTVCAKSARLQAGIDLQTVLPCEGSTQSGAQQSSLDPARSRQPVPIL